MEKTAIKLLMEPYKVKITIAKMANSSIKNKRTRSVLNPELVL